MKKSILSAVTLFIVSTLILTSCGEDKKDSASQNVKEASANLSSTEKPTQEEKIEAANITCKVFFKSNDIEEEDGTVSKGSIGERDDFRTKKSYAFCYDSEVFNSLKIEGAGKQISIEIKEGNKTIYKKEGLEIKDLFVISAKEINFQMSNKYTITVNQNNTNLFTGKIDSQGCM